MSKIKFASGSIPAEATQNNLIQEKEQIVIEDVKQEEGYQDKRILRTLPEKSSKFSRSFALNDGTIKSVYSSSPINYYDEQEKVWKELDSSLQEEGENYVSNLGKYKAKIKKNGEVAGVTVGDGNTYVEWQFLGTKIEGNKYCLKDKKCKPNVKVDNYKKDKDIFSYGKLKYLSCDDGVDIEYITQGNGVKENIIVNKKSEEYKYYFSLKTSGVKVKIDEQGDNIIFYTEKEGKEEVELMIPAPYMYDNAQEYSDEVMFELTKVKEGEYIFTVEADANWINQEGRIFPVTIDPQVITSSSSLFSVVSYSENLNTGEISTSTSLAFTITKTSSILKTCNFTVKKSLIPLMNNKVIKAILNLPISSISGDCSIKFGGSEQFISSNRSAVAINITEEFKNTATGQDFVIDIEPSLSFVEGRSVTFCGVRGNAGLPSLYIEYLGDENFSPTYKKINLTDNVFSQIDLASGELFIGFKDISDSILGMGVSHMYKKSDEDFGLGADFRLNLYETLVRNSDTLLDSDYIYTDSMGIKHAFIEHCYYLNEERQKQYVNKSEVSVRVDGTLCYNDLEVFSEYRNSMGLKIETVLNGFKDNFLIEQRNEDLINAEEQKRTVEQALLNCVIFDYETKTETPIGLENVATTEKYSQIIENVGAGKTIVDKSLSAEYRDWIERKNKMENPIEGDTYDYSSEIAQLDKLILEFKANRETDLKSFESLFISYMNVTTELLILREQIPVNYITDETNYKGYNQEGLLVLISTPKDKLYVEYKNFNGNKRISKIHNKNGQELVFEYSPITSIDDAHRAKLISITNTCGERVEYVYDNNYLIKIKLPNGKEINFTYTYGNITTVSDSDCLKAVLTYSLQKILQIKNYSTVESFGYDSAYTQDTLISTYLFTYTQESNGLMAETLITLDNNIKEKYVFDLTGETVASVGNLKEKYVEEYSLVTSAESYEYIPPYTVLSGYNLNAKRITKTAKPEILNLTGLSSFSLTSYFIETEYLNTFNNPSHVITGDEPINDAKTVTERNETYYSYDLKQNVIKEQAKTIITLADGVEEVKNLITISYYNSNGMLVKTESYVEDEEKLNGIDITENVYDENGNLLKTCNYNSLNSSDKYYAESDYNDKGQEIVEYDQSGKYATKIEYKQNSDLVISETLPNGGVVAKGYDKAGNTTSVTQNDDNGEESSNQIYFTNNKQTRLKTDLFVADYYYDYKRRIIRVELNGKTYLTKTYMKNIHNEIERTEYGSASAGANVDYFEKEYDTRGNLIYKRYASAPSSSNPTFTDTAQYFYDYKGNLMDVSDKVANISHAYTYDSLDRETMYRFGYNRRETAYTDTGEVASETLRLRLTNTVAWEDADTLIYNYTYSDDSEKRLIGMSVGDLSEEYGYDCLGRDKYIKQTLGSTILNKKFGYYKNGDHTTDLVNTVYYYKNNLTDKKITYTYDGEGNVISENLNGKQIKSYSYDKIGRLVKEKNIDINKEISYTYDNRGNILSKTVDGTVIPYIYQEGTDKLVSFGAKTFTYDDLDRPISYGDYTYTWERGRLIQAVTQSQTISLSYNCDNILVSKTVDGVTTDFVYEDGSLIRENRNGSVIDYIYGQEGIIGFKYSGQTYLYVKNLYGDVTDIIDPAGNVVASYAYTAYGESVITYSTSGLAELNRIRYRSYYYDTDLGIYYLKSRFYNPEIGRYVSPDTIDFLDAEEIDGLNLFAYCNNNPVDDVDPNGNWSLKKAWKKAKKKIKKVAKKVAKVATVATIAVATVATVAAVTVATGGTAAPVLIGAVTGVVTSTISSAFVQKATTGKVDIKQLIVDASVGAVTGAFGGSAIGVLGSAVANGASSFVGSVAGDIVAGNEISWGRASLAGIVSAGFGVLSKGVQNSNKNIISRKNIKKSNKDTLNKTYIKKMYPSVNSGLLWAIKTIAIDPILNSIGG